MIERKKISSQSVSSHKSRGISKEDFVDTPKSKKEKRNFWKEAPLGRTITLRNKAGKTLAGLGLSGITALTGIQFNFIPEQNINIMSLLLQNLEYLTDPISLAITLMLILIAVIGGYLINKGIITKSIKNDLVELGKAAREGRKASSPGGRDYTQAEKDQIILKLSSLGESILEKFGIDIDLDGDGK